MTSKEAACSYQPTPTNDNERLRVDTPPPAISSGENDIQISPRLPEQLSNRNITQPDTPQPQISEVPEHFQPASERYAYLNANTAKHSTWEAVGVHTAKCDYCHKHNTSVLQRCPQCNRQFCQNCKGRITEDLDHEVDFAALDWNPSNVTKSSRAAIYRNSNGRPPPRSSGNMFPSNQIFASPREQDLEASMYTSLPQPREPDTGGYGSTPHDHANGPTPRRRFTVARAPRAQPARANQQKRKRLEHGQDTDEHSDEERFVTRKRASTSSKENSQDSREYRDENSYERQPQRVPQQEGATTRRQTISRQSGSAFPPAAAAFADNTATPVYRGFEQEYGSNNSTPRASTAARNSFPPRPRATVGGGISNYLANLTIRELIENTLFDEFKDIIARVYIRREWINEERVMEMEIER